MVSIYEDGNVEAEFKSYRLRPPGAAGDFRSLSPREKDLLLMSSEKYLSHAPKSSFPTSTTNVARQQIFFRVISDGKDSRTESYVACGALRMKNRNVARYPRA